MMGLDIMIAFDISLFFSERRRRRKMTRLSCGNLLSALGFLLAPVRDACSCKALQLSIIASPVMSCATPLSHNVGKVCKTVRKCK